MYFICNFAKKKVMSEDMKNQMAPTDHQLEDPVATEKAAPAPAVTEMAEKKPRASAAAIWMSVISFFLAVGAWIEMVFNEYACGALAIAGLVAAIVGCCLCRRCIWRDISITSIVATGVLLLVFAIFFFGIRFALNSL